MKTLLERVRKLDGQDFVVIGATVGTVGIILNAFNPGKLIVILAVPVVLILLALVALTGSGALLAAWMKGRNHDHPTNL